MYLLIIGLFAFALASPSRLSKQYRNDYVYNSKSDAFYKLHNESVRNSEAKAVCQTEGAQLMIPKAHDIIQLHGMLKEFPDIGDQVWVASDGLAHDSAEEQSEINLFTQEIPMPIKGDCEVLSRQGEALSAFCYQELPFICKVEAANVLYDPICKVYSKGYRYYESVGSCYKIPPTAYTWDEAYHECRAEGSHLVILNSKAESQVVYNIIKTAQFFYVGLRAHEPVKNGPIVFKTVLNQTLEEVGFAEWSPGQPNNKLGHEYCGTIFKNDGKYNAVDCSHVFGFVCEKEISTNSV